MQTNKIYYQRPGDNQKYRTDKLNYKDIDDCSELQLFSAWQ